MAERFRTLAEWVQKLKPVRVIQRFLEVRGPILGSGLAFQAVFATFAALWIGFAIAGLVITGDIGLRRAVIDFLATNVPGLIDNGSGGAVDPESLLDAGIFGWNSAIAAVVLFVTALGWLSSARDAVRSVFGLPASQVNFFLLRLRDVGLALAFGAALIVSSLLSVGGTQATSLLLDLLRIPGDSLFAIVTGRVVTLAVMFALDVVIIGTLFRALSGVRIPWSSLREGALLGAVGTGALKVLGTALLGGVDRNPLLASFAVFAGILIWFNLLCQVMLIAASWTWVGMTDRGIPIAPLHKAGDGGSNLD